MANPSFRAAGTQTTGSATTTISVPPPAGHQAGDLLVLIVGAWDTTTFTTPSGWTLFSGGDSGAWGTGARYRNYVFWKLATSSSEPNVSVVQAISGLPQGVMVAVQGSIDQTTPIDATAGWAAFDTDTTIPTPAVTTVTNNALIVYIGVDTASATWGPPPTGATEHLQTTPYITKTMWADLTKATAGTQAASDYTRSTTSGVGKVFGFAVRPVTATPPVADFTGTPLTGTRPLSVAFTDASTNTPTSWAWDFGDGATSTSQNPTHSYTVAGTYTVVLIATNAGGSNTKTRTAYVVVSNAAGTMAKIKFAAGLKVTDEGSAVIRVDAVNQLAYQEKTTPTTITGTTEAGATTIVTAPAVTCDGSTLICVEVFAYSADTGGANQLDLPLFDSFNGGTAASLGTMASHNNTNATSVASRRYLTPAAGTHAYSWRGYKSAGTVTVGGGGGGAGVAMPAYIRVTSGG